MSKIPLVDLARQYATVKPEVDAAIQRVLDHQGFILGKEVAAFEQAFASYARAEGCVGVASGTAALHLALLACGVGPGDEVVTTAHTFMATGEAISLTGARPVFADVDPATYNVDPAAVERAVTPRTKAILPVHLYGHPADLPRLERIADAHDLFLVEDAAQAHGAEIDGRRVGSVGDLAGFSFYPGKNLGAYGDAGAVTGNDAGLLDRVRRLRDHGRTSKYQHEEVGFGERLDALQAAVLAAKLPRLEAWTERRREIARRYTKLLAGTEVVPPKEAPGARHVYHLYVVRVPDRDDVLDALNAQGIGAGVHYPVPLHRQPAYLKQGYADVHLPETEKAAREVLSLPIFPEMTDEEVERVAKALTEAVS